MVTEHKMRTVVRPEIRIGKGLEVKEVAKMVIQIAAVVGEVARVCFVELPFQTGVSKEGHWIQTHVMSKNENLKFTVQNILFAKENGKQPKEAIRELENYTTLLNLNMMYLC